jgi:hypothetical protein
VRFLCHGGCDELPSSQFHIVLPRLQAQTRPQDPWPLHASAIEGPNARPEGTLSPFPSHSKRGSRLALGVSAPRCGTEP